MFTIKKIWNALNHAGKPWQISMAIALGMLVGFTPLLSIHNIVVLFIVLIFNIHLAIFLLAVSFFGIIGLTLDPLFVIIGKNILTSRSQIYYTYVLLDNSSILTNEEINIYTAKTIFNYDKIFTIINITSLQYCRLKSFPTHIQSYSLFKFNDLLIC